MNYPVVHRVTVFSGTSNDVALFQASSLEGAANPYLYPPSLTPRQIRVPECTADPGQLRFRVLDKRTSAGDQQDRVFTALLGDAAGRNALRSSLVTYDVSDDGGATYQREWTGRLHHVTQPDKTTLDFSADDPQVDALNQIFDGTVPTVDWAMPPVFIPLGRLSTDGVRRYGPHSIVAPVPGTVKIDAGVPAYIKPTGKKLDLPLGLSVQVPVRPEYLIITDALREAAAYTAPNPGWLLGRHAPDLRVAFAPSGSSSFLRLSAAVIYNPIGESLGEVVADGYAIRGDGSDPESLSAVGVISLPGDDALPAAGTVGQFYVYSAAPPTAQAPLHIGYGTGVPMTNSGVHWAAMVSGVAGGAFGGHGFAIDQPRFHTLIQDLTQPKFRFRVTAGPVNALAWLDENVWPVVGFAPSVTASGGLYPVSTDPPAALPTLRLDASNVLSASWGQGRTGQVNHVRIDTAKEREIPPPIADAGSPTDMLREFDGFRIDRRRDVGVAEREAYEIKALGVRPAADGDGLDKARQYMEARAEAILDTLQDGPQVVTLVARREAATKGAMVGDHAIQAVPWLVDLNTRRRGGSRLMLITSKGVLGDGTYSFELLDRGPGSFVGAPTVDSVVLDATTPQHAVVVTVTPPGAGNRAALEVATTLSGVAAPAFDAEAWTYVVSVSGISAQAFTVPNLASRRRHHFRAIGRGADKLPSAYSAVSSIHTAAITPPGVPVTTTSGRAVRMTWANTSSRYAIMPMLAHPPAVLTNFLSQPLPAGSTRFVFTEEEPVGGATEAITVAVKYVDDFGGDSLTAEAAATIGNPSPLAAPRQLTVLQGRGDWDPGSSREIWLGTGVELQWAITEPYAATVLQYDTDAGFPAPVAVSGIVTDRHRVLLPYTDTTFHFRAYHQRDQFTTSAASETVTAKPVPLRIEATLLDGFAGGYGFLSADPARTVVLNVSSSDPDADRFYYEVSTGDYVQPTVASSGIAQAQFPYSQTTGITLSGTAPAYLWGKFWHPTKGFGQGVKHRFSAGAATRVVPTVKAVPTQVGNSGVMTLAITDPSGLLRATSFATFSGGGNYVPGEDPATWALYDATLPYNLTAQVLLTPKHTSRIVWGVAHADEAGAFVWQTGGHTYDFDVDAEVTNLDGTFLQTGEVKCTAIGDEDVVRMYVRVGIGSSPSNPTAVSNHGTIETRSGSVNSGQSAAQGQVCFIKAVGENAFGVLGPVMEVQITRGTDRAPIWKEDAVRDGTLLTLIATLVDRHLALTAVECRERIGDGAYTAWTASTVGGADWDRGSGTVGSTVTIVREEDVAVAEGKDSELQWRWTYLDEDGVSRTKQSSISSVNFDTAERTVQLPLLDFRDAEDNGLLLVDAASGASNYVRANMVLGGPGLYTMRFLQPAGQILKSITLDGYNTTADGNPVSFAWYKINADGTIATIYSTQSHSGSTGWETLGGTVVTETVTTAAYKLVLVFGSATAVDNHRLRNLLLTFQRPTGQDTR